MEDEEDYEDDDYEDDDEEQEDGEEEEEEEDEYSEDEDTEDITASSLNSVACEAVGNYTAQEQGDLSFSKGAKFVVRTQRRDGWWEAESLETGQSGMVPSNFMRIMSLEESVREKKKPRQVREMMKNVKFEALRSSLVLNTGARPSTLLRYLTGNQVNFNL